MPFEPAPIPPGYRIEALAGSDAVSGDDILAFWEREGAIPREIALRRVHEVQLVCIHDEATVAGVSTAFLRRDRQLRLDLWNVRVFVGSEHRLGGLSVRLGERTAEHLEERFVTGVDRRAAGILYEVENPEWRSRPTAAVGTYSPTVFIGMSERGHPRFVRYFPGAEAPPPPN